MSGDVLIALLGGAALKSCERNDNARSAAPDRVRNAPCSTLRDGLAAVTAGPGHDAFPDIHVISH